MAYCAWTRQQDCDSEPLCLQYPHKALSQGSIIVPWLTHVGVVFQTCSRQCRALLAELMTSLTHLDTVALRAMDVMHEISTSLRWFCVFFMFCLVNAYLGVEGHTSLASQTAAFHLASQEI